MTTDNRGRRKIKQHIFWKLDSFQIVFLQAKDLGNITKSDWIWIETRAESITKQESQLGYKWWPKATNIEQLLNLWWRMTLNRSRHTYYPKWQVQISTLTTGGFCCSDSFWFFFSSSLSSIHYSGDISQQATVFYAPTVRQSI